MSFTNGGGFVQAQEQIVATEFTSSNFSNTNQTGFDLNSGPTTDADGTPANTIIIYDDIDVTGGTFTASTIDAGTITGGTITGATITGATIIGGDIQSTNFSNTAHTGFDLNATNATDPAGTPANTIQVYSDFQVGPTGGNYLQLEYDGTQSAVFFFTSNPADSVSAAVAGGTFTQGGSGRTITSLNIASATENGNVEIQAFPSGGTGAADFPSEVVFLTNGTTAPPSWNGLKGRFFMGANGTTDVWQQVITNENSVVSSGTTLGNPALILGDEYTPRSRLFVSTNELLTVNGPGTTETLYLNENNAETVVGYLANKGMRSLYARDITPHSGLTSTAFAQLGTALATLTLPASGVLTIWYRATLSAIATVTAGTTFALDVFVKNVTASTTPYGGSTNNDTVWSLPTGVAADNFPHTLTGFITVGAGGQGGVLGATGDTITVGPAYTVSAGSWTVSNSAVTVIPSL